MGLFDRFKRRVKEVSDEVDTDDLTVSEDSPEGQEIVAANVQTAEPPSNIQPTVNAQQETKNIAADDDDWEMFDDEVEHNTNPSTDDDWEDLDDDEDFIPQQLTRKEKKRLQKEQKKFEKAKKAYEK